MMEVMIYRVEDCEGNKKEPAGGFYCLLVLCVSFKGLLQQIEFFGAADGSPAIIHPQLSVNVLGVGTHRAQ